MSLVITPFYIGLLGILLLVLSSAVIKGRRQNQIGVGDGDNTQMRRTVRVQANFTEYVPLIAVLMIILELNQVPAMVLHVMGATLLIARVLHAMGLNRSGGTTFGRFWGTLLTFIVLLSASAYSISLLLLR